MKEKNSHHKPRSVRSVNIAHCQWLCRARCQSQSIQNNKWIFLVRSRIPFQMLEIAAIEQLGIFWISVYAWHTQTHRQHLIAWYYTFKNSKFKMPNGTNEWTNKNDFDSCIKLKSLKWCAKKQQNEIFLFNMLDGLMGPRSSYILVMHIIPSKLLYCSLSIILLFGFLLIPLHLATFTIEI